MVPAEPPPSKREPGHRNLAVAALVVGGVATAVGATSVWLASAAHDDATQLGSGNGTLDEFEARLDDAHRYRWIGGAALGLGGALLITATLTLVLRDDTATPTTASVIASGDGVVVTARLPF